MPGSRVHVQDMQDTPRLPRQKRKIAGRVHRVGDLSPLASHLADLARRSLESKSRSVMAPAQHVQGAQDHA